MPCNHPSEPWHSFLIEIDEFLDAPVQFHCIGAFVLTQSYGLLRPTADVDTLTITPLEQSEVLIRKAGKGSELERKHKVYLDLVTICDPPEDYESRLTEMFPGAYKKLYLFALDPYDLALAKIGRNNSRDREDVLRLARKIPFNVEVLKNRYLQEQRSYLSNQERHDLSLELWIQMIEEDRENSK